MTATDELRRLLDEAGVEYVLDEEYGKKYPPEQRVTWSCVIAGEDMTVTARDYCIGRDESGEWEYCLDLEFHEVFTPAQAIAATVGRDERESYDAGFASGIKATLQQLYGLLHEYPTLDEIEAWADSQWEVGA